MTASLEELDAAVEAAKRKRAEAKAREVAAARRALTDAGFPMNCSVKVNTPRQKEYHGKPGRIVEWNDGEIGVRFATGGSTVWYRAHELQKDEALRAVPAAR